MSSEVLDSISNDEKKRQEAFFELVGTEKSYILDLQLIIELFFVPISEFLNRNDLNHLFQNITELLDINTRLFDDLETSLTTQNFLVERIGVLFLSHVQYLEYYTTYCSKLSRGIAFLQKKRASDKRLGDFLRETLRNPRCRNLDLSSFLLLPMQRITRYTLIFKQILHHTPVMHPDYDQTVQSYELSQGTADMINSAAIDQENKDKLEEMISQINFADFEVFFN